jgi:predicted amidophosphoribosyltransferase
MQKPKLFREISHLIFPELCLSCSRELSRTENYICSICDNELSPTRFESYTEPSPMDKLFWGRVDVNKCYAHFIFEKGKAIQSVLFGLKYKNNKSIGQ